MCRRIEPARSAGTHTIEHAVHAIERVPTLDGFDGLFAHLGQPHSSPRHFPPPPRRSGLEEWCYTDTSTTNQPAPALPVRARTWRRGSLHALASARPMPP